MNKKSANEDYSDYETGGKRTYVGSCKISRG